MMIRKLLPILSLSFLIACNSGQNNNSVEKDISERDTIVHQEVTNNSLPASVNHKELLGIWTDGNSENASFEIKADSIYYVDDFASYKYSLVNDSIKIFYPESIFAGVVKFQSDTLLITSEGVETKYWRFLN